MRPRFIVIDLLLGHGLVLNDWNRDLGLHQVLRILVPHRLVPLALNRLLATSQHLFAVVLHRSLTELTAYFIEPKEHLVRRHVAKRLVLDISVDVS